MIFENICAENQVLVMYKAPSDIIIMICHFNCKRQLILAGEFLIGRRLNSPLNLTN